MEIDPTLKLTGAKLVCFAQKLAYRAIREIKMRKYKQWECTK